MKVHNAQPDHTVRFAADAVSGSRNT